MNHVDAERQLIIVPSLLLPEVASAIGRGRQDDGLAMAYVEQLRQLPHLTFIAIDSTIAWRAASIAAAQRLRGSNAIYAAVAQRYNTTLVTLDAEQLQRLNDVIPTRTPAQISQTWAAQSEE